MGGEQRPAGVVLRLLTRGLVWGWVAILAVVAHSRVATVWPNNVTLWADAYQAAPSRPRVLLNYGAALDRAGRPEEALRFYFEAVRLMPFRRDAHISAYRQLAAANIAVSQARVSPAVTAAGLKAAGCVPIEGHAHDRSVQDIQALRTTWHCLGRIDY